jgi:integrase
MPQQKTTAATVRALFAEDATKPANSFSKPRTGEPQKLTARILEKLSPGQLVRDSVVRGMFAECSKTGAVSLKIQADLRHGPRNGVARKPESIRMTLGRYPTDLNVMRAEAMRLLADIKAGRDPRPRAKPEPPPTPPDATVKTVAEVFAEYVKDLATRRAAQGTIDNIEDKLRLYLSDWAPLPINAVTKEMARKRHQHITEENGPVAANHALKAFRTCFNFISAISTADLGKNPVAAVTFNQERSANRSIAPEDLAGWYAKLQEVENPLRRIMHEVELFIGVRPSNVMEMERRWLDFKRKALVIPNDAVKNRKELHVPLSGHVIGLLEKALVLSESLYGDTPWVFATRSADGREVIATQVIKERKLASETGHMLRHTYSNMAALLGVADLDRELLLGHAIPGVRGTYLHVPTLFTRLLAEQEKVTAFLLEKTGRKPEGA